MWALLQIGNPCDFPAVAKEYWDSHVSPYPGPKVCIITVKCLCLYNEGLSVPSYLVIRIKHLPEACHFAQGSSW